jgi:hypothetical protein
MHSKSTPTGFTTKSYYLKLILGAALTGAAISTAVNLGAALAHRGAPGSGGPSGIGAVLGALGGVAFGLRYKRSRRQCLDERLVAHQGHASRWAAFVGILIMCGWLIVGFVSRRLVRWDLVVIMAAMALTQWIALFVYGKKN